MSALVKSGLARSLHKRLPFCKVKIVFKTSNRLKNYFNFKYVVPEPLRSCQIYNFTCGSCNASYIGKTFRHMKVRVSDHQGVSPRTGKHLKGTLSTSVRDHMLDCNHVVAWDDFKVLGRESNHWLLEIKESLFIKRDRPSLNKNFTPRNFFYFSFMMSIINFNSFYLLLLDTFFVNLAVCSSILASSLRLVLICT